MLYITGDVHGDIDGLLKRIHALSVTADDILLVCGDLCLLWSDKRLETQQLRLFELPFTLVFIDGNHDDPNALAEYPIVKWNGGKVHRISENVFHLCRGEVFCIDGRKVFAMGGAYSDGRLEANRNIFWWESEIPSAEDYRNATKNLLFYDNSVDIIVTHTAPQSIQLLMGRVLSHEDAEFTGFLEWMYREVKHKAWCCGHFHFNECYRDNFYVLLDKVLCAEDIS